MPGTARAFGSLLVDQPAMRNVLADLALDSEAATVSAMRVARAYDEPGEADFRRFATAVMKYWAHQTCPGACGRVARVPGRQRVRRGLRDADAVPRRADQLDLGGLWQRRRARRPAGGRRGPEALEAFLAECELAAGADGRLDAHRARLNDRLAGLLGGSASGDATAGDRSPLAAEREQHVYESQFEVRRLVEDLALALEGSLLVRHAPPPVADAFCAARLGAETRRAYGTLPAGVDAEAIIDRALPA